MKKVFNKRTYIKYFLSYFIILTLLITGFFFIIRKQITKRYREELSEQSMAQLNILAKQLNDDLVFLSQLDRSVASNITLILSRYTTSKGWQNYEVHQELAKYGASNKLIRSMSYMVKNFNTVISTYYPVTYKNGIFLIRNINETGNTFTSVSLPFDPMPYYNAQEGQLIYLSGESVEYLLYFPAISAEQNFVFFYILSTDEIQQRMYGLISNAIPAIALIDENRRIVSGVNPDYLTPYLDSLTFADGIYTLDSSTSLCVRTGIRNGFSMVSMISNDFLTKQMNYVFFNTYLSLFLLSVIGFLLIFFSMRITYLPLHRLTRKLVPNFSAGQGYLELLDKTFTQTLEQNQQLQDKLENYRLSIKKSLLDTLISTSQTAELTAMPKIDAFFDSEITKEIFAIRMASPNGSLPYLSIQNYFKEVLPGEDPCIILEASKNNALFLVNYIGLEPNKDEILKELLINFHQEKGYLSAISNGTGSPMDIPSLCETVIRSSSCWPHIPIVDRRSQPHVSSTYTYPHDKLEKLSELLKGNNFSAANILLDDIFQVMGGFFLEERPMPDFFIHCILVDMLTVITNCMNSLNIKFKLYQELYYETLYFCRSCSYAEKSEAIANNFRKLLDICEQKNGRLIQPEQIRLAIEASYSQPDFSIYVLADKFHVSVAYISSLAKKELKQNFSDYLWNLRMQKAKELMKTTDMSIDEISIAVGYLNTSSFRRKFKQETGLTPSQFRKL